MPAVRTGTQFVPIGCVLRSCCLTTVSVSVLEESEVRRSYSVSDGTKADKKRNLKLKINKN